MIQRFYKRCKEMFRKILKSLEKIPVNPGICEKMIDKDTKRTYIL